MPKMRTRSSMGKLKRRSNKSCRLIDNNSCNNTIAMNEECARNKYKHILGSKEPIVVLIDCIMANKNLTQHIPLQYRIGDSKFMATCNKERKTGENSEDHSSISSHLPEVLKEYCWVGKPSHKKRKQLTKLTKSTIKKTNLKRANIISTNINDRRTSGCTLCEVESGNSAIIDPFENDKTLRASLKEPVLYDENSNVIGITNELDNLHRNNLMENSGDECRLKKSAITKDVDDTRIVHGVEQNIVSNKQQMKGIVCRNDDFGSNGTCLECVEDYADETDLQPENRNSGNIAEHKKATELNSINLQDNVEEDNVIFNAPSGDVDFISVHAEEIVGDKCKSSGNENFLRQKRTSTNRDANNKAAKRVKLNRNNWVKNSETECIDTVNVDDCVTKAVVESNTKEALSEMVISDISELKAVVEQKNQNVDTQSMKDDSTSNSTLQNEIRSFGDISNSDQNLPQRTLQSKATISKTNVLSEGICYSLSDNVTEEEVMEDEDDDCISLFAESISMDGWSDTSISGNTLRTDKSYYMTKDVIKNYYKRTASEFNEIYDRNDSNNETNVSTTTATASKIKQLMSITTENFMLQNTRADSAHASKKGGTRKRTRRNDLFTSAFRGYCHTSVITGDMCIDQQACTYRHDFRSLIVLLYNRDQQYLFRVLYELVLRKYTKFIITIYTTLVVEFYNFCNVNCVLKLFKKLYDFKIVTDEITYCTIESIKKSEYCIKLISDELADIVSNDDFEFVNWILQMLKNYIAPGEYWQTLRSLLLKTNNLRSEIVETILQECSITGKHIQDININIVHKLCNTTRSKINPELLSSFETLAKRRDRSPIVQENYPVQYINCISSPTQCSTVQKLERVPLDIDEYSRILSTANEIWEAKKKDDDTNTQNKKSGLTLHPIDNLPKPHSPHGRSKFWKFYIDVYSLQEGLKHNDYNHVVNILNTVKKDQQSTYTRACYQILSNEIKYSQYRLTKLVSHSVQTGATSMFFQIIIDVTIYILINLTEKNLWVLAYKLFTDIRIILKLYISAHKFDAVTIMLFAEIYLANQKAEQAFILLKQANIICTDSKKWKVKSNVKDSSIRVQIITLLLDALRETSPEHAFFLFKFLVADQYNHFYPIDLVRFANKMVTTLLLKKDRELIIAIGKLIVSRNFTLNTTPYRALISELVHLDMDLAKQLYEIAIALGIYSKVQFYPTTYVIINSDWTREEMYLATLILMQELLSHLGHAIERLQPDQFPLYFIFENIPSENQFNCNKCKNQQQDKKIEESKVLMETVLHKEFNPPISVAKKDNGKIYKLDSLSVLNYLKCVHCV